MEPRRYNIDPEDSSRVSLWINDERESLGADDDLIELALWSAEHGVAVGVTLSLAEIERVRDILSEIIERTE